jgi:hypothetical protein
MDTFYYYKGKYKVKIVTESEGYWIVEALEDFKDCLEDEKVPVKTGERRIVQPNELIKEGTMPPMISEHEYELQLEKKVKRMVKEWEAKKK